MCGGAKIAYEIARRLEAQGQKVGMLAIFDTWVMENTEVPMLASIHWYNLRVRQLMRLSASERRNVLKDTLRRRLDRLRDLRNGSKRNPWQEASWPSANFVAPTYNGPVTVFRLPKQPYYRIRDQQLGWGRRSTKPIVLHEIQAPSHGMILREPYVQQLAQKLEQVFQDMLEHAFAA
jgi:thioesterase domain-containing protein